MWRREAVAELCNRIGGRLQDEGTTRHTVLEMATILMLMTDWFQSALEQSSGGLEADEQEGGPACLREMRTSLEAVHRARETATFPYLREQVSAAQHMALAILSDLGPDEATTPPSPPPR